MLSNLYSSMLWLFAKHLNDRKANGDGSYEDDDGEYMYVPCFQYFKLQFFIIFQIIHVSLFILSIYPLFRLFISYFM